MENYRLNIKKNELLEILSNYFSKRLGKAIAVQERHSIECVGYHEDKISQVKLYYENEIDIMGHKAKSTHYISDEELEAAFGELLPNYTITNIAFDAGITTEGYYTSEHDVAYFDGIDISLKEKQSTLTLT